MKTKKTKENTELTAKKSEKLEGKKFEKDFSESFPKNIFVYRLRDGAGWSKSDNTRFTAKNICDFIACCRKTLFMELKSTKSKTSLPFSNLKENQIKQMNKASNFNNVASYFIFNFRTIEQTFAIKSEKVYDFYMNGDRKSFSLEFCKENGTIIPQQLKRTRYKYDLEQFINNI